MESTAITLNGNQLSKIFSMFESRFEERFQKIEKSVESHELVIEFLKQQIQSFNYLVSSMKAASEINQNPSKFSEELNALIIEATSRIAIPSLPPKNESAEAAFEKRDIHELLKDSAIEKKDPSKQARNANDMLGGNSKEQVSEKQCEKIFDKKHKNEYCLTCTTKLSPERTVKSKTNISSSGKKNSGGFKIISKKSPQKQAGTESVKEKTNHDKVGKSRPLSVLSEKNSSTRSPSESSRGSRGEKKFKYKDPRMLSLDMKKKNLDKINTSLDERKIRDKDLHLSNIERLMQEKKKSPKVGKLPSKLRGDSKNKDDPDDVMKKEIAEFKSILSKNQAENQKINLEKKGNLGQEKTHPVQEKSQKKNHQTTDNHIYNSAPISLGNNTQIQKAAARDSIDDVNCSFEDHPQTNFETANLAEKSKKRESVAEKRNRESIKKGAELRKESKFKENLTQRLDNEFLEGIDLILKSDNDNKRKSKIKTPSFGNINAREEQGADDSEETPRRLSVTREKNSPETEKLTGKKQVVNNSNYEEEEGDINDEDPNIIENNLENNSEREGDHNEQNEEDEDDVM